MRKLLGSNDVTELGIFQAILNDSRIESIIKNYYLLGAIGEIPPNECQLELWIIDDASYDQAMQLIDDYQNSLKSKKSWLCKTCGEKIAREFNLCWKCGGSSATSE